MIAVQSAVQSKGWRVGWALAAGCLAASAVAMAEEPTSGAIPAPSPATAAPTAAEGEAKRPFATLNGEAIPWEEFNFALQQGVRQKFYHGKVPEGELARYQREVGRNVVERRLLTKEAERRGFKPKQEEIDAVVANTDKRFAQNPTWQQNREKMLAPLIEDLRRRSLISQLEADVKKLPEPTEEEVRGFYDTHPDKFTEPEEQKISMILLKVDPSAGAPAWQTAREEGVRLVAKLREGADFAELARIHSGDPKSAEKGGRMGYLHEGMLSEAAEEALKKLAVGKISDPVMVLEGMAIFRVEDRNPPGKVSFVAVRKRATDLFIRDREGKAWDAVKKQLWDAASVQIDETWYLPLPPEEATPAAKNGNAPAARGPVGAAAAPRPGEAASR
ncbi:MAG: peptidylprolyl isomerase [Magnetococcales bacterium]|nr:peptidylprolyl isomerase [Magnetococcales bacterium]